MSGKRLLWATVGVLACWTLIPTVLSYGWAFQDYFQDWASARNWWEGISVYSPHRDTVPRYLGENFDQLGDGKLYSIVATVKVNAHPPSSVLFFLPLGLLPYGLSYVAWNALSAACLGLAGCIIARELDITPSRRAFVFVAVLGCLGGPIFEQMVFGQTNAVTLAFLTLAWRAHRRGGQVQEGCWLGAAAALKLFPLVLFMIPLGARRWRSVAAATGTMLLFLSLPVLMFSPNIWREFSATGMREAVNWCDLWPNASLCGFWKKLCISQNLGNSVPFPSPTVYRIGYALSCAALGLTTFWLTVVRPSKQSDHAYGLGICAMLLLSPTCWSHYFLMLPIPLALLWRQSGDSILQRRVVAAMFVLLFVPAGLYLGLCGPHSVVGPPFALTVLAVQTYTLIGMWGLAANRHLKEIRAVAARPGFATASAPARAA